jgi:hypothetical protein
MLHCGGDGGGLQPSFGLREEHGPHCWDYLVINMNRTLVFLLQLSPRTCLLLTRFRKKPGLKTSPKLAQSQGKPKRAAQKKTEQLYNSKKIIGFNNALK